MTYKLRGKCKECGIEYEMPAGVWVIAHLSDPSCWPLAATLPCGHKRTGIDPFDFEDIDAHSNEE